MKNAHLRFGWLTYVKSTEKTTTSIKLRLDRPHGLKRGITVMSALFPLGQIVATPGALAALERAKQPPTCFLARHAIGDWGQLDTTDVAENKYSLIHGFRFQS